MEHKQNNVGFRREILVREKERAQVVGAIAARLGDTPLLDVDESCLHTGELDVAGRCYDIINIKLDKTSGLTEAVNLARAAKEKGCKLMVGNMVGTSLAMARSFVIALLCDSVDIDGPQLLNYDHPQGMSYKCGRVKFFSARFWA